MTDTVFVNGTTLSDQDWFNDLNRLHYTIFGDPASLAAVKTTLGTGDMTFTGNVSSGGSIAASGSVTAGTHIFATTTLGVGAGATGTDWRVTKESANVNQYFANSATHVFRYDQSTGAFFIIVDSGFYGFANDGNSASKNVAGQWVSSSDARIKQDIQDYTSGLNEVLKLRPRVFSFRAETGHDTTRRYVGMIAQEAQVAMPETVTTGAITKVGDIDLPDLLSFDPTNIQYALVNAIKTLNERITALENAP